MVVRQGVGEGGIWAAAWFCNINKKAETIRESGIKPIATLAGNRRGMVSPLGGKPSRPDYAIRAKKNNLRYAYAGVKIPAILKEITRSVLLVIQ
jgi:hypothetical protein